MSIGPAPISIPDRYFRCVCGHLNAEHRDRKGHGAYRCSQERCGCSAFTWDGSPEVTEEQMKVEISEGPPPMRPDDLPRGIHNGRYIWARVKIPGGRVRTYEGLVQEIDRTGEGRITVWTDSGSHVFKISAVLKIRAPRAANRALAGKPPRSAIPQKSGGTKGGAMGSSATKAPTRGAAGAAAKKSTAQKDKAATKAAEVKKAEKAIDQAKANVAATKDEGGQKATATPTAPATPKPEKAKKPETVTEAREVAKLISDLAEKAEAGDQQAAKDGRTASHHLYYFFKDRIKS